MGKATRRLVPLMAVCYFFAYLDRTNLSVAALTMNAELGLSARVYGFGAGLLFVGYVLLDAPSNLIMHRVGASRWMARIMIVWGLVAASCALIQGETSFYLLRFLLGVAEAGFFPWMILYLTYWFPASRCGTVTGLFMVAVPLSTALGAPLGGLLLKLDGIWGLSGWRWLFLTEGLPSVLLRLLLFWLLPERPAHATWLTNEERLWLKEELAAENASIEPMPVRRALLHPRVLGLGMVYFTIVFGLYGLGFWMPTILKANLGIADNFVVTLLTAIPYAIGAVAMVWWGRHGDRDGRDRALHGVPDGRRRCRADRLGVPHAVARLRRAVPVRDRRHGGVPVVLEAAARVPLRRRRRGRDRRGQLGRQPVRLPRAVLGRLDDRPVRVEQMGAGDHRPRHDRRRAAGHRAG